jgi:hypothetical protein
VGELLDAEDAYERHVGRAERVGQRPDHDR